MLGSEGAALTTSAITTLLSSSHFVTSGAAGFSFGNRLFLGVNDPMAGFNSAQDAVIEITVFNLHGLELSYLMIALVSSQLMVLIARATMTINTNIINKV